MQVLINSNNSIQMSEELQRRCSATVEDALQRFSEQLTRVEVHLTDENGEKSGAQDKRCLIEARIKARDPVSASHKADTLDMALDGATDKLQRVLETTLGKLQRA